MITRHIPRTRKGGSRFDDAFESSCCIYESNWGRDVAFSHLACEMLERLGVYLVNELGWGFDGSVGCCI